MDWLLAPIDPSRPHEVTVNIAWHGRSMLLAWGILAPLAIFVARFMKIMPGQDWPRELDNPFWWRSHWIGQCFVLLLTIFGLGLVFQNTDPMNLHARLGYTVVVLLFLQAGLGVFRGSKGGPTAPASDGSPRGDHYDMTPWRVMFEWVHKTCGYVLLLVSALTILFGLWQANAPVWMWAVLTVWWVGLIVVFLVLQRRGYAIDTYQAIWGPDPEHPGNNRRPIGWGVRQVRETQQPGE